MAKIVRKDDGEKMRQDEKRSALEAFQKRREAYQEKLRNDDEFQLYIIEPFEAEITKMADVRNFPSGSVDELANLTYHIKLALNKLDGFLKPLKK